MSEYIGEHISIRDCIVCVEKRKGVNMRRHSTLADLAYSLLYRWPEDQRGKEWVLLKPCALKPWKGSEIRSRRGRHLWLRLWLPRC